MGQRLVLDSDRAFAVVGVAENFLAMGATAEARPQFFLAGVDAQSALLLLRSKVTPESLTTDIRAALFSVDPEVPLVEMKSMDYIIGEMVTDQRMIAILMASFAALALLLAMVGVYSVLASLVTSQTRELGIRMALGATTSEVGRMVARQSLKPLVAGLVLGLVGSLALGRFLTSLLVGVEPNDPVSFALSAGAVIMVAPLAVWGPVRRATRVECTVALREE